VWQKPGSLFGLARRGRTSAFPTWFFEEQQLRIVNRGGRWQLVQEASDLIGSSIMPGSTVALERVRYRVACIEPEVLTLDRIP
jgi:hypothetical protein